MKLVLLIGVVSLTLLSCGALGGLDTGVVEPPEMMRIYATGGDAASAFNYGVTLAKGGGGKPDPAQAVGWFRRSAAAGFAPGQLALAVHLLKGDGVPQDEKEAVKWFAAAGTQGIFEAQKAMIFFYSQGVGVEKNAEKALIWDFLARRTLELRFEQSAGVPPMPAKLRSDGSAEYLSPGGKSEVIGPDGSIEQIGTNGTRKVEGEGATKGARRVTQSLPVTRFVKVSIAAQLAELAKIEREARYFAGVTPAQYDAAELTAQRFVLELPQPPQRPLPAGVPPPRFALRGKAPPLPGFVRLATDRNDQHPLGLQGRVAIRLHPWQHTETEHFIVHYINQAEAYSVMADIECTFINVTHTLMLDPATVRQKSHVFIFPSADAWKAFKEPLGLPAAVTGFAYKAELYLGVREDRENYLHTLCHETAHAVVARFYPARKWPLWLNEGFAEYMSAKQRELRLVGHREMGRGDVDVDRVFHRTSYEREPQEEPEEVIRFADGTTGKIVRTVRRVIGSSGSPRVSSSPEGSTARFYEDSERCVRTLLEVLPPRSFPRFANLAFAGNAMTVCLREAYGSACTGAEQFETLVNSGAKLQPPSR